MSGPIAGGTFVNISGKDLGSKFEEVQNAISIAGVRCAPLRERYQPSQWIVCKLGASVKPRSGIVTVALPNRPAVNFHEKFFYQVGYAGNSFCFQGFNHFPHTTILQQTTLDIFCQKIENLCN